MFKILKADKERGSFLLEMLCAIGLAAMIFTFASDMTMNNVQKSFDTQVVLETEKNARAILDLMIFDLRMLGSGIPFDQSDFTMSDSGVGAAALPVYTDSTTSFVHFRINELGNDTFLLNSFMPDSQNSLTVESDSDLVANDVIYISDETAGGSDGLQATVASANSGTVTLTNMLYSTGATFPAGSIANRVVELSYNSPNDSSGITRNNGYGDVVLMPNSTFSINYIDSDGNQLALPLTTSTISSELNAIEVTVNVISNGRLRDGTSYTASVSGQVGIRSLNN